MNSPKPNLFVVGAPKCGTSALTAYLDQHPQVFICDPKEPFFWSSDYPGLRRRHGMNSLECYLRLFADVTASHLVIGEGSTNYLRSSEAIPQILEFNPDARFIAMLRNPIEVVHAFHSEICFSYIEDVEDFETAWRLQGARQRGESMPRRCEAPQFLQYADVASYAPQIERFLDLIPASQRHVIVFDDFAADTAGVFQETQRFLGLEPIAKDSFERVNAAHAHRSQLIASLVLDPPPLLRPVVSGMRQLARQQKGGWIDKAKRWMRRSQKRTPLAAELRRELADFFCDDVQRLSELLDRDLTHWVEPDSKSTGCESMENDTRALQEAR
ncbi:MAG: sulfotransferase [Planctomycetota bacterium]|nr:sulfotransferase [Planctomycetota bacterium]